MSACAVVWRRRERRLESEPQNRFKYTRKPLFGKHERYIHQYITLGLTRYVYIYVYIYICVYIYMYICSVRRGIETARAEAGVRATKQVYMCCMYIYVHILFYFPLYAYVFTCISMCRVNPRRGIEAARKEAAVRATQQVYIIYRYRYIYTYIETCI